MIYSIYFAKSEAFFKCLEAVTRIEGTNIVAASGIYIWGGHPIIKLVLKDRNGELPNQGFGPKHASKSRNWQWTSPNACKPLIRDSVHLWFSRRVQFPHSFVELINREHQVNHDFSSL